MVQVRAPNSYWSVEIIGQLKELNGSQGGFVMDHPDQSQGGFTVLEALISLTILAMTTAGILSIFAMIHFFQDRSEDRLMNAIQARSLLDRAGLDIQLEPGTKSGVLADGRVWSLETTSLQDADWQQVQHSLPLYDVRVHVSKADQFDQGVEMRSIRRGAP
jgi:type II secretory pathway pseudopilin PulG